MTDVLASIERRKKVLNYVDKDMADKVHLISNAIVKCIKEGHKVLTCGNGGSAANAQHFTGDMVGRYKHERIGFPCITLSVDNCAVTAISNDYDYKDLYAKELIALGREGDILICLSSSGNSENVIRAAKAAKKNGIINIGLLGNNGGNASELMDYAITIPDRDTDLCEEFACTLIHIILEETEEILCDLSAKGVK